MPEWEISLTRIPLMAADTLILGEELPDSNFMTDDDDLFHIFLSGQKEMDLSEQMRLESIQPDSINGEVGAFKIEGNQGQRIHFNIYEVFPQLQLYNGARVPIPGSSYNISKSLQLDNFYSVTFESGTIYIKIINNLAFPLGKPVRIALYDRVMKDTVSVMLYDKLIQPFGGEAQAFLDLAGKTISNNIQVILTGTNIGTGFESVYLSDNQGFDVEISMSDLIAVAAEAKIPSQSFSVKTKLDLSTDSLVINSARVTGGDISFFIESNFYMPVQIRLFFPGILDEHLQPKTEIFSLLSKSSEKVIIYLANTTINMGNGKLDLEIFTTLLPQTGDMIKIAAGDKFIASAQVSELKFSELTAALDLTTLFPSFEEEILQTELDLPKINLQEVIMSLDFENNPSDMLVNLKLDGENVNDDATAQYTFQLQDNPRNHIEISRQGVNVNGLPEGSGNGLVDLINILPQRVAFSGSARLQDDNATLSDTPIKIDYSIDVPMVFSIQENTLLEGDTTKLDFNGSDNDRVNNLQDVKLEFTITNGLPIGGNLEIRLADSLTCASQCRENWPMLTTVHFDAAGCDADGNVINIKDEMLSVSLNKEQIKLLTGSDFLIWSVKLDALKKARLKATDKIILKNSYITGTMKINEETFDND
ncbi:hypothetical protein JXQ31_01770 [candidate division KSB1 bacterium]|nr:hypothetical protein [candidate division KSB1 bacterium]